MGPRDSAASLMAGAPKASVAADSTPFEDQQLAGLLMWIPMDGAFFAVAGWLFVAWLGEAEHRATLAGRRAALLLVLLRRTAQRRSGIGCRRPRRGVALMRQFGCGACHIVPGISGADGLAG